MIGRCPPTGRLEAMLDDALEAEEARRVEEHVSACVDCQRTLEDLTRDTAFGRSGGSPAPTLEVGASLGRVVREPPTVPATPAEAGLTTWAAAGPREAGEVVPEAIPGYEVLGEIGRGGMGVVYRARDPRLKRVVALKVLLQGGQASAEMVARFRSEAETIARLQHPNVVRVHSVGAVDGRPYIEMEYVDGGSLAARLDGTPRPVVEAARLVEAMARGVEEVHRLGVVHRDLKPANVLIAADGTPKLGDFGLAKALDEDAGLTRTGAVVGTPSYMAPEQAEGGPGAAGPAADVYALGAICYELLTGRPPFRAASVLETLRQVKSVDPVAPSRLVPGLPRDVETIALKCLEKLPSRRYPTAGALAEDLRRFLDRRPILARPIGPAGRLARWCRRNPGLAGLSAAIGLLLLTVTTVSVTAAVRIAAVAAQERRTLYFARMNLVQQAWEANDTRRMADLLGFYEGGRDRDDLRGFEWSYWWRLAHLPAAEYPARDRAIVALAFSPDGKTLAAAERGPSLLVWDRARGGASTRLDAARSIRALAYSRDGSLLAAGGDKGSVFLWKRGEAARKDYPELGGGPIEAIAFSEDGRSLVVACEPNVNRTLDLESGRFGDPVVGSPLRKGAIDDVDHAQAHALSPGGALLAAAAFDGSVLVRPTRPEPGSGLAERTVLSGDLPARSLAFSPDGKKLAAGGEDWTVRVVDLARPGEPRTLRGHSAPVWSLAFSPDGETIAAASFDNTVTLWEVESGRLLATLKGHGTPVNAVAFAPDGGLVASGGNDPVVNLWKLGSSGSGAILSGHEGGVQDLAFAEGGSTLLTAGRDGRILSWSTATGRRLAPAVEPASPDRPDGPPSQVRSLAYSARAGLLASGGWKAPAQLRDARTLDLRAIVPFSGAAEPYVEAVAIAPDGKTLALALRNRPIALWRLPGLTPIAEIAGPRSPNKLAFSPDGATLAASSGDEAVRLYAPADGRPRGRLAIPRFESSALAYSADGRLLAVGGLDGSFAIWDVASRRLVANQRAHSNHLLALAFSPDGRTLATGGRDNMIRLWDPATGSLKSTLKGHENNVFCLAFSPDGKTLASGSLDRTARLWTSAP